MKENFMLITRCILSELADRIIEIAGRPQIPLYIFSETEDTMYLVRDEIAKAVPIPPPLKKAFAKKTVYTSKFKKKDKILMFYFIRFRVDGDNIIIAVQDSRTGKRFNDILDMSKRIMVYYMTVNQDSQSEINELRNKLADAGQGESALAIQNRMKDEIKFLEKQLDEAKRASLENNPEKMEELNDRINEKQSMISTLQSTIDIKDREINHLKEKAIASEDKENEKDNLIREYSSTIEELRKEMSDKRLEMLSMEEILNQSQSNLEKLGKEINFYEETIKNNDEKINSLENDIEEKSAKLFELEDDVHVLRASRIKMLQMLDGLTTPLVSVTKDYIVNNVNKSAGKITGTTDLAGMVGTACHRAVFGYDEKCPWCKKDEVLESGKPEIQEITLGTVSKTQYEHVMFPIEDRDGKIVEVGELLIDITNQYKLKESIEKAKEQINRYKRQKLEDINHMEEMKKLYKELGKNYELIHGKYVKATKAMETLTSQDSVNELIRLRTEIKEYRVKLSRAGNSIKNYKQSLSDSNIKYNELNKKTIYQIERLINVLSNKKAIRDEDTAGAIAFMNSELTRLRKELDKQITEDKAKAKELEKE